MKWLTKRRFVIGSLSVFLAIALVLSGVTIVERVSPSGKASQDSILQVGFGQKVIRIGTIEASGAADYTCTGVNDNVVFQTALNALPAGGGRLEILGGHYVWAAGQTVTRAINNVTINGVGASTNITGDGVTALFTAGGNNWNFSNLRTDAGGISVGATTGWQWNNVTINTTYYASRVDTSALPSVFSIPVGLLFGSTSIVITSDAPSIERVAGTVLSLFTPLVQVADGIHDEATLQAAINAVSNNSTTFVLGKTLYMSDAGGVVGVTIPHSFYTLKGSNTELQAQAAINIIKFTGGPGTGPYFPQAQSDVTIEGFSFTTVTNDVGTGIWFATNQIHPTIQNDRFYNLINAIVVDLPAANQYVYAANILNDYFEGNVVSIDIADPSHDWLVAYNKDSGMEKRGKDATPRFFIKQEATANAEIYEWRVEGNSVEHEWDNAVTSAFIRLETVAPTADLIANGNSVEECDYGIIGNINLTGSDGQRLSNLIVTGNSLRMLPVSIYLYGTGHAQITGNNLIAVTMPPYNESGYIGIQATDFTGSAWTTGNFFTGYNQGNEVVTAGTTRPTALVSKVNQQFVSTSEIKQYASALASMIGDVRGLWMMYNKAAGSANVPDYGRYGYNATASSNLSAWTTPPDFLGSGVVYTYDGIGNYLNMGDHAEFTFGNGGADSPFSVLAVVKLATPLTKAIISKRNDGANTYEWTLDLRDGGDTGKIQFLLLKSDASAFIGRTYTTALTADNWYVIWGTYSGSGAASGVKIYINGLRVDDADRTSGVYVAMSDTAVPVTAAAFADPKNYMAGQSLAYAITGTELTAAQVWSSTQYIKSLYGIN